SLPAITSAARHRSRCAPRWHERGPTLPGSRQTPLSPTPLPASGERGLAAPPFPSKWGESPRTPLPPPARGRGCPKGGRGLEGRRLIEASTRLRKTAMPQKELGAHALEKRGAPKRLSRSRTRG